MGFHSTFNAVKEFADISLKHCKSLKCFGESLPASMQTVQDKETHEPWPHPHLGASQPGYKVILSKMTRGKISETHRGTLSLKEID